MSESDFRKFLFNTLRQSLYLAGKRLYEHHIESGPSDALSSKKRKQVFLAELSNQAAKLAEEAVKELEDEGIRNSDDVLRQQGKVKQITRKYQELLQTRLQKR